MKPSDQQPSGFPGLEQDEVPNVISPFEATCGSAFPIDKLQVMWTWWALPSVADVIFLVLLGLLAFSPISASLLHDADTGWHIRTGEIILASHSVPRTDPFSYTRAGQPWYAWEWLYDAVIDAIHHVMGLNGVALFTATVIALTFALLFHFLLRRSGSFSSSVLLTLLAAAAAQVHMLARPHVLSWLFTLLWLEALYRFEDGKRSALIWLPPLMLFWVNVHGGFVLGLALLALFGGCRIWSYLTSPAVENRQQILDLAMTVCACLAATMVNPYGSKLHVHVYQYLSNSFFMNSINEFMSPNFHVAGYGYFELLIFSSVVGIVLARGRIGAARLLVLLLSIHAGLYSARNIPLAAIMMTLSAGPLWAGVTASLPRRRDYPRWLRAVFEAVHDISENMARMEQQFRGHILAIALVAVSVAIALNGGRLLSAQLLSAHFDEKIFPVKATDFIAGKGIHDHMFSAPDNWGGYLIYRLYPETKLYFDDRHDFYGEAFIRDYLKTVNGSWEWREPLDKYHVQWVFISVDSPLSSVLKESRYWRVEYDDGLAIVFSRIL